MAYKARRCINTAVIPGRRINLLPNLAIFLLYWRRMITLFSPAQLSLDNDDGNTLSHLSIRDIDTIGKEEAYIKKTHCQSGNAPYELSLRYLYELGHE
jgi:hypothetical protein